MNIISFKFIAEKLKVIFKICKSKFYAVSTIFIITNKKLPQKDLL